MATNQRPMKKRPMKTQPTKKRPRTQPMKKRPRTRPTKKYPGHIPIARAAQLLGMTDSGFRIAMIRENMRVIRDARPMVVNREDAMAFRRKRREWEREWERERLYGPRPLTEAEWWQQMLDNDPP
jgi:hypothetical protein